MKTFTGKSRLGLLLCLAGLLSIVAPQARADEEKDPPTRVARISYVDGSVSLQPGGQGDWGSAARNRPMTIGDKIWVDKDSRAELQAGTAAIHLGSMTALSFLNLDQGITQMRLAEGSINFRVSELREGDLYEVDAPNLAFTVKQAGAFRIDVNENGDSARVTVIRGEGEVTASGKTYEVHSGERGEFTGNDRDGSFGSVCVRRKCKFERSFHLQRERWNRTALCRDCDQCDGAGPRSTLGDRNRFGWRCY